MATVITPYEPFLHVRTVGYYLCYRGGDQRVPQLSCMDVCKLKLSAIDVPVLDPGKHSRRCLRVHQLSQYSTCTALLDVLLVVLSGRFL